MTQGSTEPSKSNLSLNCWDDQQLQLSESMTAHNINLKNFYFQFHSSQQMKGNLCTQFLNKLIYSPYIYYYSFYWTLLLLSSLLIKIVIIIIIIIIISIKFGICDTFRVCNVMAIKTFLAKMGCTFI